MFPFQRFSHAARWSLCAAVIAGADANAQTLNVSELDGRTGVRIGGLPINERFGVSVDGAGDVNGDGFADVIIGAELADPGGRNAAGASYVIFGGRGRDLDNVDLANLGSAGFRIDGIAENDFSGENVAGAGDVNGDGLADLLVAAEGADVAGRTAAGQVYVVFGKADANDVALNDLSGAGFRIDGAESFGGLGRSIAALGDMDGDGFDDIVVGDWLVDVARGSAYVVFGKADDTPVDLAGAFAGFEIRGLRGTGYSVAGPGDVNGDGIVDVLVGTDRDNTAYLVFGKVDAAAVDLTALGAGGFEILEEAPDDGTGRTVSAAGDVNGDGVPDLLVGAEYADVGGRFRAGSAYVVFGKNDNFPVDLSNLGTAGFRIDGTPQFSGFGGALAGPGDLNGDGLDDLLIGGQDAWVVFGKTDSSPVAVARLGDRGYHIDGTIGRAVGAAGDVNGDSVPDIIVGNDLSGPIFLDDGEAFILFAGPPILTASQLPPPEDLSAGDRLGAAVASSGNRVAVGLPDVAGQGGSTGRVLIYRLDGDEQIIEHVIDVPESFVAQGFGAALALEGDRLAVGAPQTDPTAAKVGITALQAAIFERATSGDWRLKVPLASRGSSGPDAFGAAVALDGNRVVVGAPEDNEGTASGAAYVFQIDGESISAMEKLKPVDATQGGQFGAAVAASQGHIAVGQPQGPIGAVVSGSIHLFQAVADNLADLNPMGALSGDDSAAGDALGTSVALDGPSLIAGAPGADGNETDNAGAAYLFDIGAMRQTARIVSDVPSNDAAFGTAVALSGGVAAVGAPGEEGGAGAAFRFDTQSATQVQRTAATGNQRGLGSSVSLSRDIAAAGAPLTNAQAGAALVLRPLRLIHGDGFEGK